jgi:hypothetical protein
MHGDSAEVALPHAAPVCGDGETYGFEGLHIAEGLFVGVHFPLKTKLIGSIQFMLSKGRPRSIMNQIAITMSLAKGLTCGRVIVLVEGVEHLGEGVHVL